MYLICQLILQFPASELYISIVRHIYGALWEVVIWGHKGILSYDKSWCWIWLGNSKKNSKFIMFNYFHILRNFSHKIKCDVATIAHTSQYGSLKNVQRLDFFRR